MTAMEDKPAGSVGDVGQHGDKWSFTLFDAQDREIVAFTFRDENTAVLAAETIRRIVELAMALSPAKARGVPIAKA
jgi:hypothetical protein